jgi:signal peptidase I
MGAAPRTQGRVGRALSGIAVALGCVLLLGGFVLAAFLYQPYEVPSDSMSPTIITNDRVLAQRIDGREVHRGDVVVFRDDAWSDQPLLKRAVGIGGDTVACCDTDGMLTVNGVPIDEPYRDGAQPASPVEFEAEVPAEELFLLGDERVNSVDSRFLILEGERGTVHEDAVLARVEAVAWPPSRLSMLDRADGFAELPGGVSGSGPLRPLVLATTGGAVLILAGAAVGPLAARMARRRA